MNIPDFKKNPRMLDWWCKDPAKIKRYQYSQDLIVANGMKDMPELPQQIIDPKIDGPDVLTSEQVKEIFNTSHFFYCSATVNPQRWNYPKILADAEAKYGGKYRRDSLRRVSLLSLIKSLDMLQGDTLFQDDSSNTPTTDLFQDVTSVLKTTVPLLQTALSMLQGHEAESLIQTAVSMLQDTTNATSRFVNTEYDKNRWFTESGMFRASAAQHLGIPPPYPSRITPVACGSSTPPPNFILPDDDRLADFIIEDKFWNYPALIAELELLNDQKLWVAQAKNMIKDKRLSDLVVKPLEQYDIGVLKTCVKEVLSHTQVVTKKMLEQYPNITPAAVQIIFEFLTEEEEDGLYIPTPEGRALGLDYEYLEPHKFGNLLYHEISEKEAKSLRKSLDRYYLGDTFLSSLAALDFVKTFGKVPNKASIQRLGKDSS